MIKKIGGKYVVLSESGRRFGSYATRAEAEKRLRQIEMFKHLKKGGAGRRRRG
jgi:hypothetical protein